MARTVSGDGQHSGGQRGYGRHGNRRQATDDTGGVRLATDEATVDGALETEETTPLLVNMLRCRPRQKYKAPPS